MKIKQDRKGTLLRWSFQTEVIKKIRTEATDHRVLNLLLWKGCEMGDTREQQATFTKLGGFSWITAVSDICLFLGEVDLVTKAQGHTL